MMYKLQSIMKEVETQEPRFVNTLVENNGRYDGVNIYLKLHLTEFRI